MSNKKRYVAVVEFYVYADSDAEAIKQTKKFCDEYDSQEDNNCQLVELVEQPFGTIGNRQVKI